MNINTDSHFVIGQLHVRQNKPCQDHALDYTDNGIVGLAVLSDGCSSGGNTDIGARIMTASALRSIKNRYFNPTADTIAASLKGAIMENMTYCKDALFATDNDLLATCSYAVMTPIGGIINVTGDGCAVIKYTNGKIAVFSLEWRNNTPYYFIYNAVDCNNSFVNLHKSLDGGFTALATRRFTINASGKVDSDNTIYCSVDAGIDSKGFVIRHRELSDVECVAIFSDGVQDFQKGKTERIPVEQVIYEMMSFKNYTGDFVKRRVSAALKKFAKDDIHPADDFSMSAIHFDHSITESV